MSKHTPAPWILMEGQWADHSEDGGGGFHVFMGEYEAADGIGIISARLLEYGNGFYPDDNGYEEVEANARLIAAAPELLAELQRSLETLEAVGDLPSMQASIRAAIAKATGAA